MEKTIKTNDIWGDPVEIYYNNNGNTIGKTTFETSCPGERIAVHCDKSSDKKAYTKNDTTKLGDPIKHHYCWRRLRRAKSGGAVPLHFGDWIKDTLAAVFSKSGDSPFPGFGAVCQRCSDSGLREDSLFFAAIRPPVKRQKATVEAEAIQDRRSGGRIEDFSPVGGDEIRRDKGRGDFRTLGYNLKESVGLFFRGDHIAQFIQTKDMDARIIVDQRINVFGFGQLGRQIE